MRSALRLPVILAVLCFPAHAGIHGLVESVILGANNPLLQVPAPQVKKDETSEARRDEITELRQKCQALLTRIDAEIEDDTPVTTYDPEILQDIAGAQAPEKLDGAADRVGEPITILNSPESLLTDSEREAAKASASDDVNEVFEYSQLPSPVPEIILKKVRDRNLPLGPLLRDTFTLNYRAEDVFTEEQLEAFRKFSKVEDVLNRGLVIVSAPVWVPIVTVAAVITRLESPGPVIFTQERIGQLGKPFKIYKLRTMRTDVEGPTHTVDKDPRVTRFGALFRRWKVDELFQLFNIAKGDMGIVGHRPLVPYEVDAALAADPRYGYKFLERPGLTSLGQIRCDHCSTPSDNLNKARHDLYGMTHKGPTMFIKTIIGTVFAVIRGKGAR
jgi:lipopolysaccharide/colanic/teichoic acid biosynthesis glycosyltransferase